MEYNFLILSALFTIPGWIVFIFRKDLRIPIYRMALLSLPFATTEFLFYPDYWEPKFLFDLIEILGFGLEDMIFVIGLSAFTTTAYVFIHNKIYITFSKDEGFSFKLLLRYMGLIFILIVFSVSLHIKMIYGSIAIMAVLSLFITWERKDLFFPGLWGGFYSLLVYSILSRLLILIYPDIFLNVWKMENFSNIFILSIPLEELIYGFMSGFAATVFYPRIWNLAFSPVVSGDRKAY